MRLFLSQLMPARNFFREIYNVGWAAALSNSLKPHTRLAGPVCRSKDVQRDHVADLLRVCLHNAASFAPTAAT